ncbi:MAG: glycosyltransferase [Clostridiales bacterium]|nr:glycosyltransferase [Clostridiales bacterium]
MNIALILPALWGGGAERAASELSYHLAKKNTLYIFTRYKTKNDYPFCGTIIKLSSLGSLKQTYISDAIKIYSEAKQLANLKERYNISVSISFMEEMNIPNILSKGKDRVIASVRTTLSGRKDLQGLYYNKVFLNFVYNRADAVVVLSRYGKADMIRSYGIKRELLKIIPNHIRQMKDVKEEGEWNYGNKVILSIARISEVKQQQLMVECLEQIKEKVPEAKLLLIGNNATPYASRIAKYVKEKRLGDAVKFIGQVDNVTYYLQHSKVFINLSKAEGFPNAVLEAMTEGVPVVALDAPGANREILAPEIRQKHIEKAVHGKYGVLCPCCDEDIRDDHYTEIKKEIVSEIIQMLENGEQWTIYAQKAKERSLHFTADRVNVLWDQLIENN